MMLVSDLMTAKVFTLETADTLLDVRALMNLARVRHIPVTDATGTFLGLLTHRDLLAYTVSKFAEIEQEEQSELESSILVKDIMQVDVKTTTPDTKLKDAAETLYRHKYGCLPVLDDNKKLVGIITEADFLRLAISLLAEY